MRGRGYRFWDAKRNCYAPDDDFWITYKGEWATHLCSKYSSYKGSDIIAEQSTGLPDRNGKEIYEGDIWEREGFIATVEFVCSQWNLIHTKKSSSIQYPSFFSNANTGQVIGNIHENQELLNGN